MRIIAIFCFAFAAFQTALLAAMYPREVCEFLICLVTEPVKSLWMWFAS